MNTAAVDKVAKALLYEGYLLYPYRPSAVKNQQRFNFGVLYPRAYSERQEGSDSWFSQTECLVFGTFLSGIEVKVRFLHLIERSVQHTSYSGVEAEEREVCIPVCNLMSLISRPFTRDVTITGGEPEQLSNSAPARTAAKTRIQHPIRISLEVRAAQVIDKIFKLAVRVMNADSSDPAPTSRDEALTRSPISTHTVLGIQDGEFISLLDPTEALRPFSEECKNVGTFPVLIGDRERNDTLLSSPIILYDYPEIAGESAGDLFDSLEIDEILSLRIMTLTDEEKQEIRKSDDRARRVLERTENLPEQQLMKLHGALRGLRPVDHERA